MIDKWEKTFIKYFIVYLPYTSAAIVPRHLPMLGTRTLLLPLSPLVRLLCPQYM